MVIPVVARKAKEYETHDGKTPFRDWLVGLKDGRGKAKITKAVTQMEAGNFGDHKPITDGNGLHERRIDYGPGYRIYYVTEGEKLIILFAGSDKSGQKEAIISAKNYLDDYQERKPKEAKQVDKSSRKIRNKRNKAR
ncbi:type II toxin-antitoxin system RelE/ParE family toxin [Neptunomonas sp.]|uniref:type II toxin-antitoxin system RelE/ParE family toxin n=1 Tax=Neptunomonas sp. TaxID=1971898 RepID=UPI0035662119